MRRRDFIALGGGAVAGWPLGVVAQQPTARLYRIGMLEAVSATLKNYVLVYRSADGAAERFPSLARADEVIE